MSGNISAGQSSGTGAMTELDDEKVRKNEILSNRDKAQRLPNQSLDGMGVAIDEYKDVPSNRRPPRGEGPQPDKKAEAKEPGSVPHTVSPDPVSKAK